MRVCIIDAPTLRAEIEISPLESGYANRSVHAYTHTLVCIQMFFFMCALAKVQIRQISPKKSIKLNGYVYAIVYGPALSL